MSANENERKVITPGAVAQMYGCDVKTVGRWANAGKLPYFLTPAGTKRFYEDEIRALIESSRPRVRQ